MRPRFTIAARESGYATAACCARTAGARTLRAICNKIQAHAGTWATINKENERRPPEGGPKFRQFDLCMTARTHPTRSERLGGSMLTFELPGSFVPFVSDAAKELLPHTRARLASLGDCVRLVRAVGIGVKHGQVRANGVRTIVQGNAATRESGIACANRNLDRSPGREGDRARA
jgi:hypothetical protein